MKDYGGKVMRKKIDFNFIDIHTHILFGVDDGAPDARTSEQMLDTAYSEGIRKIVATPHYHPGKCLMPYEEIKKQFDIFKEMAHSKYPDMEFYLGREIYYTSEITEQENLLDTLLMNGTKYVLVEYYPAVEFSYIRASVNNIIMMGYIPIVAHVERYICHIKDWTLIEELRDMGAVIQINAGSVTGQTGTGSAVKKFVKKLLSNGYVDVIGTDAHSTTRRAPRIKEAAEYIAKKYGIDYAKKVLYDNAEKILKGEYLEG